VWEVIPPGHSPPGPTGTAAGLTADAGCRARAWGHLTGLVWSWQFCGRCRESGSA
jgi:hypothetical protein